MPYRISVGARNACVDGYTSLLFKGAKPNRASINFYSNATIQPATPETAVPASSVLLATVLFSSGAFFAAASATGIASGLPLQGAILANGTVEWFRFLDGSASPSGVSDGNVTLHGASGNITFDNITFSSGAIVSLNALSISMPM